MQTVHNCKAFPTFGSTQGRLAGQECESQSLLRARHAERRLTSKLYTQVCNLQGVYIQSAEQFVSAVGVTYGRLLTYGRLGLALGLGRLEFLYDGRVEGGPGQPAAETAPASLLVVTQTL